METANNFYFANESNISDTDHYQTLKNIINSHFPKKTERQNLTGIESKINILLNKRVPPATPEWEFGLKDFGGKEFIKKFIDNWRPAYNWEKLMFDTKDCSPRTRKMVESQTRRWKFTKDKCKISADNLIKIFEKKDAKKIEFDPNIYYTIPGMGDTEMLLKGPGNYKFISTNKSSPIRRAEIHTLEFFNFYHNSYIDLYQALLKVQDVYKDEVEIKFAKYILIYKYFNDQKRVSYKSIISIEKKDSELPSIHNNNIEYEKIAFDENLFNSEYIVNICKNHDNTSSDHPLNYNYNNTKNLNLLSDRTIESRLKKNIYERFYYFKDIKNINMGVINNDYLQISTSNINNKSLSLLLLHDILLKILSKERDVKEEFNIVENKNDHFVDLDINYWVDSRFKLVDNSSDHFNKVFFKKTFSKNIITSEEKQNLDEFMNKLIIQDIIQELCIKILYYRIIIVTKIKNLNSLLHNYYYTKIYKYKKFFHVDITIKFNEINYLFDMLKKLYCNLNTNLKIIFGPYYNIDTIKEVIEYFNDHIKDIDINEEKYGSYKSIIYDNNLFHQFIKKTRDTILENINNANYLYNKNLNVFNKYNSNENTNTSADLLLDNLYDYACLDLNFRINKFDIDQRLSDLSNIDFPYIDFNIKFFEKNIENVKWYMEQNDGEVDYTILLLIVHLMNTLDKDKVRLEGELEFNSFKTLLNNDDIYKKVIERRINEINLSKLLKIEILEGIQIKTMFYIIFMYINTLDDMFYNKYILSIFNDLCNTNNESYEKFDRKNRNKGFKNLIQLPINHNNSYSLLNNICDKFSYIMKLQNNQLDKEYEKIEHDNSHMINEDFNKKYNKQSLNTTNLIHSYYTTFIKNIKERSKITSKLIDNEETGSLSISPFNSMSPDSISPHMTGDALRQGAHARRREQAQAASAAQSRIPSFIHSTTAFRRAPVSAFQDTASQRGMPSAWDWEQFDEEADWRRGGRKKKKKSTKKFKVL